MDKDGEELMKTRKCRVDIQNMCGARSEVASLNKPINAFQ